MGTGGCITGTASHLKSQKPSCRTLGVFNVFGDETPGPRNFEGFNSCSFPWSRLMDATVDVASVDSYRMSMLLSREGLICGPSSGQALQGILDYVGQLKKVGGLAQLADATTGEVSCVFTLSDLPYQYLPQYFEKLGEDEFPEIQNKVRLIVTTMGGDERELMTTHRSSSDATNSNTTGDGFSIHFRPPRCCRQSQASVLPCKSAFRDQRNGLRGHHFAPISLISPLTSRAHPQISG